MILKKYSKLVILSSFLLLYTKLNATKVSFFLPVLKNVAVFLKTQPAQKCPYYKLINKCADPFLSETLEDLRKVNRVIANKRTEFASLHNAQLLRSNRALALLEYFQEYHPKDSLAEQETLHAEIYDASKWLKDNSPYEDIKLDAQANVKLFGSRK